MHISSQGNHWYVIDILIFNFRRPNENKFLIKINFALNLLVNKFNYSLLFYNYKRLNFFHNKIFDSCVCVTPIPTISLQDKPNGLKMTPPLRLLKGHFIIYPLL
jgi:hypothetical protein